MKKNLDGKVEGGKLALRSVVITPRSAPRQGKNGRSFSGDLPQARPASFVFPFATAGAFGKVGRDVKIVWMLSR
jgi:hypothetical protein